jgi:hypothetical protein
MKTEDKEFLSAFGCVLIVLVLAIFLLTGCASYDIMWTPGPGIDPVVLNKSTAG